MPLEILVATRKLILTNALAVSEDTKWQLIFSAVQSMNSN
jgi:hypothetical protein